MRSTKMRIYSIQSHLPIAKTIALLCFTSSMDIALLSSSEEKETSLLILDDVGAVLKNVEIGKKLRQIIYMRRHLKCHIVILLQSFLSIPKEVRKVITNYFMFKPSKAEFGNFCEATIIRGIIVQILL